MKFWSLSAVAVAVLAVLAWGGWRLAHERGAAGQEPSGLDPNRLAVLYFQKSEGSSDSLGYLADGLTEALIHELGNVGGLQVISSNGVRPYRKGDLPLQKVAQELHVGTLVNGSISQSGNMLRLNVALVDAGSGIEIGSRRLERPREEIFALQDDLAKEVSVFLRQQLGKEYRSGRPEPKPAISRPGSAISGRRPNPGTRTYWPPPRTRWGPLENSPRPIPCWRRRRKAIPSGRPPAR